MIFNTIRHVSLYIISYLGLIPKNKLHILIYLADKYHLQQYGRTITNDVYFKTPVGPKGLHAKKINLNNFKITDDYGFLPDSDKKVLDYIIKKFGKDTLSDLIYCICELPEYLNSSKKEISKIEMFSKMNEFDIDDSHISISKEVFQGYF